MPYLSTDISFDFTNGSEIKITSVCLCHKDMFGPAYIDSFEYEAVGDDLILSSEQTQRVLDWLNTNKTMEMEFRS